MAEPCLRHAVRAATHATPVESLVEPRLGVLCPSFDKAQDEVACASPVPWFAIPCPHPYGERPCLRHEARAATRSRLMLALSPI